MASARKRLALNKLDKAENPFLHDIPKNKIYSKAEREKLTSLRVVLREEKYLLSSLWKKYPKLSLDWSERNSVFDMIVNHLLNRNPGVPVVGKDEIILTAEKKSTYAGPYLPANPGLILRFYNSL